MGLFSTKYKTSVSTQVQRVIPDDLVNNSTKSALIKSLFQGTEISDTLLEEQTHSMANRAEKLWKYGRDHYVHGLPAGYSKLSTRGVAEVQAVIDALEGGPVSLDYVHMGNANTQHIGWMKLIASHGYNPATNKLGNLSTSYSTDVHLDDFWVVVPTSGGVGIDPSSLQQWGISPKSGPTVERKNATLAVRQAITSTPIVSMSGVGDDDFIRVTWVYGVQPGPMDPVTPVKGTFDISVNEYNGEGEYFHVKYVNGAGVTKYWIYLIGSGVHPSLDAVNDIPAPETGTFFPYLYFRYFKTDISGLPADEAWHKTSKKMAKIIGMDFDALCEGMHENPDIDDVEQAMLMFAVPANPESQPEKRYLYDFFLGQFYTQDDPKSTYMQLMLGGGSDDIRNLTKTAVIVADPIFKTAVVNGGIYKKLVRGSIGGVGSYASGRATQPQLVDYLNSGTGLPESMSVDVPYHYYRRQVSPDFYDEVQVFNLRTVFFIFGSYATIGDEEDDILLIPLDKAITEDYDSQDREKLYSRAMHYVYNSRVITPVKWYQSELFSFILIVVAVVITVWSMGTDGGSALSTAIAAGNYAQAINLVAMGLLKYAAVTLGVKLFVKLVGPEIAFIIAVIAVIAGVAINQLGGVAGAPWASDLLSMASNLTSGIDTALKSSMQDLLGEVSEFQAKVDKDLATIEKAQALLDDNSLFLTPYTIFGENPEQFYGRTVHSGNIGVLGIQAVSNYVDIALKLPTIDDTLGGIQT